MSGLLQHGHLFLEAIHLLSRGVGHVKVLRGHLSMPVAAVHLADTTTPHALPQTDAVKRDAPLVHHTVSMLLREGKARGKGEEGRRGE